MAIYRGGAEVVKRTVSSVLLKECKIFEGDSCGALSEASFQAPCIARHAVAAEPIDDGDEQVKFKGPNLAVVYDLSRFSEIDVADDRSQ